MKTKLLLLLVLIAGFTFTASAQVRKANHRVRAGYMHHQNRNITKGEALFLHKKKQHIRHEIRVAKMDDRKVGPMERRHIKKDMKQYRRAKFVAEHNRRTRF